MNTQTQQVLDRLNQWEIDHAVRQLGDGADIWQDVILRLGGYDETATAAVDDNTSTRFVADGVTYVYDPSDRTWSVDDGQVDVDERRYEIAEMIADWYGRSVINSDLDLAERIIARLRQS